MKLLAVLLLTLGLVFEAGPSCATPAQTSMVPVAIDCSGMGDSDRSTPDSNGKDRCHFEPCNSLSFTGYFVSTGNEWGLIVGTSLG